MKLSVFLSILILTGLAQALAPNIYLFIIARVFGGIAAYGRFMSGYVLRKLKLIMMIMHCISHIAL